MTTIIDTPTAVPPKTDRDLELLLAPSTEDLATVSDEVLEHEVVTQAAHVAAANCRFILLIAELDRRELWGGVGIRSCAHWLNWRCGLDLGAAREHVRVGRALAELPRLTERFSSGALSYSKVRALTRVAAPHNEESLVELAEQASAAQLEVICRSYRRAQEDHDENSAAMAMAAYAARSLSTASTGSGTVVLRLELPSELAAIVESAVDTMADRLYQDEKDGATPGGDVSAETRLTATQRRADAMVALAEGFLTSPEVPTDPVRPAVAVHVDEQVLKDPSHEGCCALEGLGTIGAATARRLCCDGVIKRFQASADGTVELVGHTRAIPRRLRRALWLRDGGCRFPGCASHRFVDGHHVVFWSDGGPTELSNLVLLCRNHHRLVHEGGYRLDLFEDGSVLITTPAGETLPTTAPPMAAEGRPLVERHRRAGFRPTAESVPYNGERFDLGLTIDALLCLDRDRSAWSIS